VSRIKPTVVLKISQFNHSSLVHTANSDRLLEEIGCIEVPEFVFPRAITGCRN
jgi:hypothetical protein